MNRRGLFAAIFLLMIAATRAAGDEQAEGISDVEDRWVRKQATPNGEVTLIKEHKNATTTLTATDAAGNVLYAHVSDFTVEDAGKVHIFTFFNRLITAGPGKGQMAKEPVSFVYRVSNDRFIEVYGLLANDPSPPRMIVWERWRPPAAKE